jgi:tetratricopeptide (TPR) repeat protein
LQWSHLFKGDLERSVSLKQESFRKADERVALRWVVSPLCVASLANTFLGRWDEAVKLGTEVLGFGQEHSDDSLIAYASWIICVAYTTKGDLDRAVEYGEQGVEKAPTPQDKSLSGAALGWALCRAGEWEKGIERMAEVVQAFRNGGLLTYEFAWTTLLAEGYLLAGDHHKGRETAEEAAELADRCGAKWFLGFAHRVLGEVALKTNPNEAAPHIEKAIQIAQEIKAENELALAYSGMGRYHKQQGNIGEARKYLTDALEIFERLGTLIEPDKVRKELAELPQ